jgi:Na+-driven multidrug efflux pump
MITMFIGAGCNVVLAPIFIFVLDMGIKGAAIATDISMGIGAVFVLAHFFKPSSTVKFCKGIYRLNRHIIWAIISIGAAPCIVNLTGSVINVLVNRLLYAYGGDVAVGAVGIFTTYTSLICMFVVGICQGVQPILGYNYGAGKIQRMKKIFWLASSVGLVVTTLGALVSIFFPRYIAMAFTVDEPLIAATANGLHISTIMFWAVGFQIVSTTLFQSIGMAGKSIFLSLIRQVIFLIPLLLTLPHFFGIDGVWASYSTSDVGATLVTIIMVAYQMRRLKA